MGDSNNIKNQLTRSRGNGMARTQSVLMVCSREVPDNPSTGREKTLNFIKSCLGESGVVELFVVESILARRSFSDAVAAGFSWCMGIVSGKYIPIQTLLFSSRASEKRLVEALGRMQPTTVYLDGVRVGRYAFAIRRKFPRVRIVCDFDDLMSRRFRVWKEKKLPISLGYMGKLLPKYVAKAISRGCLARLLISYEAKALALEEARLSDTLDSIVLVNSMEASFLRERFPSKAVLAIPPVIGYLREFREIDSISRFVFVGSDFLAQNRLTIDYLIDLWEKLKPSVDLHIVGRQTRKYRVSNRVIFDGFVDDLNSVYMGGTVVLAPAFVEGGVKTKILEAIGYGIVPVGNGLSFEGVRGNWNGLALTEKQLLGLLKEPSFWISHLNQNGATFYIGVVDEHSRERLGCEWRNVIWPSG